MKRAFLSASIAAIGAMPLHVAQVQACDGFELDLTALTFEYTVTNPDALPGEVIGNIAIFDEIVSRLTLQKYDLGTDGVFGGEGLAGDTLVDLAKIDSSSQFETLFEAEVIKLGANDYTIYSTTFATSDTCGSLASPAFAGDFVSDYIAVSPGIFAFAGSLVAPPGTDSILWAATGEDWVFTGVADDTPTSPDQDGVLGSVRVLGTRSDFIEGRLGEFQFGDVQASDLDTFFASDQFSPSGDIKVSLVPEPGSALLLIAGLMVVAVRRRRRPADA